MNNVGLALLTSLIVLGGGCVTVHETATPTALAVAETMLSSRYELLRGDYSVAYAVESDAVEAGRPIEVKVVITNTGSRTILVPVPLSTYVTLHYSHVPDGSEQGHRISSRLGGESNDLLAARRLEPGNRLAEDLTFDVPDVSPGMLRVVPSLQSSDGRGVFELRVQRPNQSPQRNAGSRPSSGDSSASETSS